MVPDALYKYGIDYSELISHDIGSQHLAAVSQLGKTEVKAYRHHSVASTGFIGLAWYKYCRCTFLANRRVRAVGQRASVHEAPVAILQALRL